MAREPATILDPLRRLITRQHGSVLSDAALLENFVSRRDEPSFEVLVWRHGAMVLAVCKRVLRDAHEAEDAFQATFLVFARKAAGIGRGELVASWLYKVAYRIALRLRAAAAKRASGAPTDEVPAPEPADADWRDLRPVLDDEIAQLPEKYRTPFVLCYLEGRTNEEAAEQLGCPKGTILSRLSRGRERLRARLGRRGIALSATALALTLSQNAASASVPAALVSPTAAGAIPFVAGRAAAELVPAHIAALAEGVLKTMTLVKIKIAAAVFALAVFGTTIAASARGPATNDPPANTAPVAMTVPTPSAEPAAESNAAPAEQPRDRDRPAAPALTGRVVSVTKDGKSFTVETPPTERGGAPGKTEVKFAEKAAVTYNGVGANGAAPTAGYQASVWFEKDSKESAATVVFTGPETTRRGPDVAGVLVSFGRDRKSITVQVRSITRPARDAELPPVVAPVDEKTQLVFSNVGKDRAKPAVGQMVMMWYADDGKTAGRVEFTALGEGRARDEKRPEVVGKVVRTDGKTLVIESPPTERGGEPTRTTVTVDDRSAVTFHTVPEDGARITVGLQVQVWLADGSKTDAAKARFTGTMPERWKTVSGKVIAVAKDGSSVTLETSPTARGEEPKRTEVKLTAKTKLAFFGVSPGEAKPAEGLLVQVQLLDGSTDTASHATFGKPGDRGR